MVEAPLWPSYGATATAICILGQGQALTEMENDGIMPFLSCADTINKCWAVERQIEWRREQLIMLQTVSRARFWLPRRDIASKNIDSQGDQVHRKLDTKSHFVMGKCGP